MKVEIKSPCISVCVLDDSSDFCLGCYRTVEEIERWSEISNEEKKHLLALLEERRSDMENRDFMN